MNNIKSRAAKRNLSSEEQKGEITGVTLGPVTTADPPSPSAQSTAQLTTSVSHSPVITQDTLHDFLSQIAIRQENFMERMSQKHEETQLQLFNMHEELRAEVREHHMRLTNEGDIHIGAIASDPATPGVDLRSGLEEASIRRINRRDSAASRLTTFGGIVQRENLLTLQSDKHTSIVWETRTVDGFLRFFDEIDKFTLTHNQPVPYLFTHIADNLQEIVAELLYVHKPQKYSTKLDVFKATTLDILEMAQIYFAPRDLAHFNILLMNSCKSYEVKQRGDYYASTRLSLHGLKKKFMERFEFLSKGAIAVGRRDAIPAINYKHGGVLNVWTDLTPEGSRESFKQLLINGKYDTLEEFLERYFVKVEETNNLSENIRVYKYRIGANSYDRGYNRDINTQRNGNLHCVEDEEHSALDPFANAEDEEVYFMNEDEKVEYSKEACPKLLIKGKCWHRDCKYSHKVSVINEHKDKLLKEWTRTGNQMVYANRAENPNYSLKAPTRTPDRTCSLPGAQVLPSPGSSAVSPVSGESGGLRKLQKEKTPLAVHGGKLVRSMFDSKTHRRVPSMRIMDSEDIEESGQSSSEESNEDPQFSVISAFLQMEDSRKYLNVARRPARAKLVGDSTTFEVKAALFDTGASANNYISKAWVEQNQLQQHLLAVDKSVKVANGSVCNITSMLPLNIVFVAEDGTESSADLEFHVLDGLNMEVVIGLPSICQHFKRLFIDMIGGATISNIEPSILRGERTNLCWSVPLCEEEKMIPEPDSFSKLFYLESSYEDSLKEFLEVLPSRIDEEFNIATPVFEYLSREAVDVFVPRSWEGINGVEVKLDFDPSMPERIKPAPRKIPAAVLEPAKKEFDRMCQYMYRPSTSPVSSPLVVAPKATPPFVRLCGDYKKINKFIRMFNFPIPDAKTELHRAAAFKIYIDLDMKNAFHGFRLFWLTSRMLSIQTPYGQFEPIFMPEGVSPASLILMAIMGEVFADYYEWMIVIFDNILVLAHDYNDAFAKLVKVITRCKERNIVLKLSKSRFGVKTVEFFGYVCSGGSYTLSQQRIAEVAAIPFPSGPNKTKKMQQFLGASMYFRPFIYRFADKTAKLHEMVQKNFNWDRKNWTVDYEAIFESFKEDILNSFTLNHPDYNLPWFLYVDASDYAVGGVLVQLLEDSLQQVVAFVSKKFTANAQRWSTIEKEAFAMFYSVQKLQYYLFMKEFTLLTDHNNLLWMESSEIPKIVRMRTFLQSFRFDVIHVKGKDNVFADWLSRMYTEDDAQPAGVMLQVCQEVEDVEPVDEIDQCIASVHNSRMGHHGVQRTWLLLNKYFPAHGIPIRIIQDYITKCVWCQKVRSTLNQALKAPIRAIVPEHPRHMCGYDTLYVTRDRLGRQYLHVFKFIPSRLVCLYPAEDLSAEGLASAMFLCFTTYGVTDVLITDPGSNINSEVVKTLLKWMGVRLRMSIVGRHQSNMVERSHRETLRFLSTLVNEERLHKTWSEPQVIATIQFILNSEISSETSVSPFEYTFGSEDRPYFRLPDIMENTDMATTYMRTLNENLGLVRKVAKEVQAECQRQRMESDEQAGVNAYVVGDMVFVDEMHLGNNRNKLASRYTGPYVIQKVYKADITCKHIVTGKIREVHMEHLKPFFGTTDDAYRAAMTDDDQHMIHNISNYKGDPELRSGMEFKVLFADGDDIWLPYNQDLASSAPFVQFCQSRTELKCLLYTVEEWKKIRKETNAGGICGVQPGDTCFVNLRAWGWSYVENIGLPNILNAIYVVPCRYIKWIGSKKCKIEVKCELFGQLFDWTAVDVNAYGKCLSFTEKMTLVDEALCHEYPKLLG
jgi:hypothetical protein